MAVFNDRVLFVHIPKTGGTALKHWLWEHLPGAKGQRPASMPGPHDDGGLPIGHVPLRDIEEYTGRSPESFERIVAVIRNPYAQQLSQWRFWRERYAIGDNHVQDICAASHPTMASWLQDPGCDFHVWYEQRWSPNTPQRLRPNGAPQNGYDGFGGYYRYWLTVGGLLPENLVVCRLEQLDQAWPRAMDGAVHDPHAPIPRVNTGPSRPYPVEFYYRDPKARELVEAKFRWAFEHHYRKMQ